MGFRLMNFDGVNVCCMVELRWVKVSSFCMKFFELVFIGGLFSKLIYCFVEFNFGCCIVGVVKVKGFESFIIFLIFLEVV